MSLFLVLETDSSLHHAHGATVALRAPFNLLRFQRIEKYVYDHS